MRRINHRTQGDSTARGGGSPSDARTPLNPRTVILGSLLGLMGYIAVRLFLQTAHNQPMGLDFSCFWAGARVALDHPARLYDFDYVTHQQAWLIGARHMRPFIYPPSSLPVFLPFAALSYWPAYALWVALTGALFLFAALRAGARWWIIAFPPLAYVAVCGQITFLMGGLIVAGLSLRTRPLLAGVLFGLAGAVKPQLLVLLPVALVADRQWRTIAATAFTAGLLAATTAAVWGVGAWLDWLRAVPRFQQATLAIPSLARTMLTPYATLEQAGIPGAWAWLLVAPAALAVWFVFRRTTRAPERLIALIGATLLIIPYAMNYEMALLTPAVAAFLARSRDRRWPASAVAAPVLGLGFVYCLPALLILLTVLGWAMWPSLSRQSEARGV
jgi:hypothetical protein